MAAGAYHDLLLHFAACSSNRRGGLDYVLRVHSSESELFAPTRRAGAGHHFKVSFPRELFPGLRGESRSRTGAAPWGGPDISGGEVRHVGSMLRESLPDELVLAIDDYEVPSGHDLRLKISSDDNVVNDLPWEWLCDLNDVPFGLRPDARLVRSVPVRHSVPPLTVSGPLRILLVVSGTPRENALQVDEEREAVSGGASAPDYELRVLEGVTAAGLREALLGGQPHVIHYVGHAGLNHGEGSLILHDRAGGSHWVCGSELAQMLPSSVRLLCLSTCFTRPNYQLLGLPRIAYLPPDVHLPTIVANRFPPAAESVRVFWRAFYRGLIERQGDAGEAVHGARRAVAFREGGPQADWSGFILVVRDGTGVVLKFERGGSAGRSERQSSEVQAQFATRMINDLAEQLKTLGEDASEEVRARMAKATERFSAFLKVKE